MTRLITYEGETDTLGNWARRKGFKTKTLKARLDRYHLPIADLFKPLKYAEAKAYLDRGQKVCSTCKKPLPLSSFYKIRRKKTAREWPSQCKLCDRKRVKGMREALRLDVLRHYSGPELKCAFCPENRVAVLDLDHINGGGRQERIKLYKTNQNLYVKLKREDYPPGYRVLCRNDNWLEWLKRKDAKLLTVGAVNGL
jgi:hypothetical protein